MAQMLQNREQATTLYEQGLTYADRQQWDKALEMYEQALKRPTEENNPQSKARIYVAIAHVKFTRQDKERDLDAALNYYGKALTIFQGLASPKDVAKTHCSLAKVLIEFSPNQKEAAIAHYKQALTLFVGEETQSTRAEIWQSMGEIQLQCQDWNAGLQSYREGALCYKQARDLMNQATLYQIIGDLERKRGNELAALDSYNKVIELYKQREKQLPEHTKKNSDYINLRTALGNVYQSIGKIKRDQRDWNVAGRYYALAATIYDELEEKAALETVVKVLEEIESTSEGWRKSLLDPGKSYQDAMLAHLFTACQKRGDLLGAAYLSEEGGKRLRDTKEATDIILEAFQDARWYYGQVDDKRGQAYTSEQIATSETSQHNLAEALEDYGKARWFYGESFDVRGQAYTSQQIATIEAQQLNLEAALQDFRRARDLYSSCDDTRGLAYIYQKIGEVETNRQNYPEAIAAYKEALEKYCAVPGKPDEQGEVYILQTLGDVELARYNWSNALEYYQDAQLIYQKNQNPWGVAHIDRAIGEAHGAIGEMHRSANDMLQAKQEWAIALQRYQQALSFFAEEEHKVLPEVAAIYFAVGGIQKGWGKLDEALKSYRQAASIYERLNDFSAEAHVFEAIIDVLKTRRDPGDLEDALQYAQHTAELYQIVVDPTREKVLHDIETNLPLCAIALAESEKEHIVLVGKTYVIQAGIEPEEQSDEFEIGPHDLTLALCDELAPLFIDMTLYTGEGVTCIGKPHQRLSYSRKNKARQLIEFRFKVNAPGDHAVEVDFYHKRRWLKTIPFKFKAIKQSRLASIAETSFNRQSTPLPMVGNYPVNVSLRIRSQRDNYTVDVSADGYRFAENFPILSSSTGIVAINTCLHEKIATFVDAWGKYRSDDDESLKIFNQALKKLVVAGKYAHTRIFSKTLKEQISQNLQEGGTIQIAADNDFVLPWELLYEGPLDSIDLDTLSLDTIDSIDLDTINLNTIDPRCFWGLRYQIIRKPTIPTGRIPSPELPACPRVGLIANVDLPAVYYKEIPEIIELHDKGKIEIESWPELNESSDPPTGVNDLLTHFLQEKGLDILHIACHTSASEGAFNNPYLVVSKDFILEYNDLNKLDPFVIKNQPLVILNACRTGQIIDSRYSFRWPQLFWRLGARGVLATEFVIPDGFAADFIAELYARFTVPETTISDALFATRKYFLEVNHNILGLAYALYAPSNIKIARNAFLRDDTRPVLANDSLLRDMPSVLLYGTPQPYGRPILESGMPVALSEVSEKVKQGHLFYCSKSKKLTDKYLARPGASGVEYLCEVHQQPLRKILRDNITETLANKVAWSHLYYCAKGDHLLLALVRDLSPTLEVVLFCPEHHEPVKSIKME